MTAPVAIFAYNRPAHLARVLSGLEKNPEASRSRLYLFCDGPRRGADESNVHAVRQMARQASGFGQVDIIERDTNFGLARSIVEGVRDVCAAHGRAIVLEDDVVPTPYFLSYVNAALDRYADVERVVSVGCHTFDSGMDLPETFFLHVPDCWGWGVWRRSWDLFDANGPALLRSVIDSGRTAAFDFDGTYPYTQMLKDCADGFNQMGRPLVRLRLSHRESRPLSGASGNVEYWFRRQWHARRRAFRSGNPLRRAGNCSSRYSA